MAVAQRDVVPNESNQEYLLELWKQCLVEMLADVAEVKVRHDDAFQAVKANSMAAVAELRANAAEIRSTMEAMIEKRLVQIREPADGPRGEPGPPGEPGPAGKIERLYEYVEDAVHYRGDTVTHRGSTYQARCDTAREPPHVDWVCLARAGVDGKDGRDGFSLNVRGTFKAAESYRAFDIVALNGGSFIARRDDPGDCPGGGWQLMSMPGRRGQQGPRGERGPAGPTGPTGCAIKSWQINWERYQATPLMSDGSEGPTLELRPLFEQFLMETLRE